MDEKPNWKVTFSASKTDVADIMSALEEMTSNTPSSVSAFEDTSDGQWYAEGLYAPHPSVADILAQVSAFSHGDIAIVPLEDEDWVAKSLENLQPIRAGRFYIHGTHNEQSTDASDVAVLVDAGQAFGTGHHGTTRGCLLALDEHIKHREITNALDLGCGTGILAVALAKVSKAQTLASDNDPIAVEVTRQVAADNGVEQRVETAVAQGFNAPLFKARAPFDFIFANILARPLIELAPEMATHLAESGTLILSGLLATQETQVLAPYEELGFSLASRFPLEEWMTLVLER